jgi:hypothetical protein
LNGSTWGALGSAGPFGGTSGGGVGGVARTQTQIHPWPDKAHDPCVTGRRIDGRWQVRPAADYRRIAGNRRESNSWRGPDGKCRMAGRPRLCGRRQISWEDRAAAHDRRQPARTQRSNIREKRCTAHIAPCMPAAWALR